MLLLLPGKAARAQVNTGSDGHNGAFNPTTNTVINMANHPDGIYQYTSVNIPTNVTVTFIPNANNTPVVWLVQSNCLIGGTIDVSGKDANGALGGLGGPGGYAGGTGDPNPTSGRGPGGGAAGGVGGYAGFASYGTLGTTYGAGTSPPGPIYGNSFILPLLGGSGGGGQVGGGGGGGGAILIAVARDVVLNGRIAAKGGDRMLGAPGSGSGGAVRVVATSIAGSGAIEARGGGSGGGRFGEGGGGRVRFDALDNSFGGWIGGLFTQGFQPVIIPAPGQGAQLTVTSVGGVPVSVSPTGQLATPDAVLSAQQTTSIPIVVHCANLPLNTQITVSVKPANGATVSATGLNNTGTLASSTATLLLNMPRGGGLIYATAATGN